MRPFLKTLHSLISSTPSMLSRKRKGWVSFTLKKNCGIISTPKLLKKFLRSGTCRQVRRQPPRLWTFSRNAATRRAMSPLFFQLSSSGNERKNSENREHSDIAKPYGSPSGFLLRANLPPRVKSAKFYTRAKFVEKLEIVKNQSVAAEFFAPSFCGGAAFSHCFRARGLPRRRPLYFFARRLCISYDFN